MQSPRSELLAAQTSLKNTVTILNRHIQVTAWGESMKGYFGLLTATTGGRGKTKCYKMFNSVSAK